MGLFGFGKKNKVLDLSERYKMQMAAEKAKKAQTAETNPFSLFDSPDLASNGDGLEVGTLEEKKRKLAKRIADMTEKTEDLGNQIYHLEQRLEVLERKFDIKRV